MSHHAPQQPASYAIPSEGMSEGKCPLRPGVRWELIGFGWLNVGLGMVGVAVPGLPTTIFLIIALWAFSKSSERFHGWLYNHPRFGPPLQAWRTHRAVPVKAKLLAVGMMTASFLYVTLFVAEGWLLPAAMALVMLPVAAYVTTRPSMMAALAASSD